MCRVILSFYISGQGAISIECMESMMWLKIPQQTGKHQEQLGGLRCQQGQNEKAQHRQWIGIANVVGILKKPSAVWASLVA